MPSKLSKLMRGVAADHTGDLNNHQLVRLTQSKYPDEWAAYENERAMSGALTMADGVLDSLGRSPVQRLPGMEDYAIPSRVTIPDGEGGIIHRRFQDCTIVGKDSDLLAHERSVLRPQLEAMQAAVDEFESTRKRVERSARKLKVTTGEEWLRALEGGQTP